MIKPWKVMLATSLFWILGLASCGGITIKTWFSDVSNVRQDCQNEKLLIRKDSAGQIQESLTLLQANGYRCYSPEDDVAWRNRLDLLSQCCNQCPQSVSQSESNYTR